MSIGPKEYAKLSDDAYNDRSRELRSGKEIDLDGIRYKVLAVAHDLKSDYQGTAYQRVDTKEVIVAHRGTASVKDGLTDAGMVFTGRNNQLDQAMAFTDRAIAIAKKDATDRNATPHVSITGHSLGGTLAEITAAKHGLHAETFNAFGPAGLSNLGKYGVDARGQYPNIVNHVRATDVVGAGGAHFGKVHTYAVPQDIERLKQAGYMGRALLPANPLLAADLGAHTITNFLPGNKVLGQSILSPQNEKLAGQYNEAIEHYRRDVRRGSIDLSDVAKNAGSPLPSLQGIRLQGQIADAAATKVIQTHVQAVKAGAAVVGQAADRAGQAVGSGVRQLKSTIGDGVSELKSIFGIDQKGHPGHTLFKQAQDGIKKIDAQHGHTSGVGSNNAAACLAVAACRGGLTRIDEVGIGADKLNFWAAQGPMGVAQMKLVSAPIPESLGVSIAQSTQNWEQAHQLAQQQQADKQTHSLQQVRTQHLG